MLATISPPSSALDASFQAKKGEKAFSTHWAPCVLNPQFKDAASKPREPWFPSFPSRERAAMESLVLSPIT